MRKALKLIEEERERQINKEGWSEEHDDKHTNCALALAASCYAVQEKIYIKRDYDDPEATCFYELWPWEECWDNRDKHNYKRKLVIAGALIVAELERLERLGQDSD